MQINATLNGIFALLLFFISFNATQAQTLDASFSSPSTIVCGDGTFTLNATNSSYQSYSWTISGPNAFTSNLSGSSASLNLTQTGLYDVSLTVSDGVSTETNTINGFLTVGAPSIVDAGVDQTICANSPVQLNGSIGGSATSAYWISWGSGTFSPTNINLSAVYSPSVQDIASGYVQLILSTNDPVGPCSAAMDTIQIYIDAPVATVDAGVDQTVCANSVVQLNGTFGGQATSIFWSGGSGTFTPNNASLAPTYSPSPIEITNGFVNLIITTNDPIGPCPAVSDTVLVAINQLPTFTLSSNSVCVNSSLQISSNNPQNTFNISNPSVATFGSNGITGIAEGTFFITVMSPSGCMTTSEQITVTTSATVNPIPNQIVCAGESITPITFSGSAQQYNWTNDNSSIGLGASGTGNILPFQTQNTTSGTQIANLVVTPILDGCNGNSETFSITVNPLPIVNAGNDTTLCSGQSYTPIANGTATSYSWINYSNGVAFIPPSSIMLTLNGELNGCIASDNVLLTVVSNPIASITTFDGEDSLACDGTLSVLVTGGTAPYSYTWTNGASNYTTSAIQDLCSGTYSLAVVDANGCSATTSATINDTLIENVLGDTLIFTDNIYLDSTIIGSDTSAWIENCTFDYSLVTGVTIDSYIDNGVSTIVTWIIALSNGSTVSVDATYYMSPGTSGVYNLTLQLFCNLKSGPKFLIANSRLYFEPSTIGVQSLSLNGVFLYPNPTSSTLSISGVNSDFSYKISDLQGKTLKQGANEKQIEIGQLPAGTYVIGISTDNEVKQLRFVKL